MAHKIKNSCFNKFWWSVTIVLHNKPSKKKKKRQDSLTKPLILGLSLFKIYVKSRPWWFLGSFVKKLSELHISTVLVFCRFLSAYPNPEVDVHAIKNPKQFKLYCFIPAHRVVTVFTNMKTSCRNNLKDQCTLYSLVGSPEQNYRQAAHQWTNYHFDQLLQTFIFCCPKHLNESRQPFHLNELLLHRAPLAYTNLLL